MVIRDLAYSLPYQLPQEWIQVENILRASDQLIWIAEYNSACINALKKRIGLPDEYVDAATNALKTIPNLQEELNQGVLDADLQPAAVLGLIMMSPPLKKVN